MWMGMSCNNRAICRQVVNVFIAIDIPEISALGFLGLGAQAPQPEWGTILADSKNYMQSAPWTMIFPGLAIMFTVLGFNLMGDGLRDALDPRMKS